MNCRCKNMDKRALSRLAERLEKLRPTEFDMNLFCEKHSCGTVACIAGWSCIWYPKRSAKVEAKDMFNGDIRRLFSMMFGTCEDHSSNLIRHDAPHRTPKQAAKAIRRLVKQHD
jgi:hypothetical protein